MSQFHDEYHVNRCGICRASAGERSPTERRCSTVSLLPLRSFYQAAFPKLVNLRENEISDWPCDIKNILHWVNGTKVQEALCGSDFHVPYPSLKEYLYYITNQQMHIDKIYFILQCIPIHRYVSIVSATINRVSHKNTKI